MRMINLLAAFAVRRQAARLRRVAARELAAMSACELGDMGITRLDVSRLFEPGLAREFLARGSAARVAAKPKPRPCPRYRAAMTSLELSA